MTLEEIANSDKFNEYLGFEIEAYRNRPTPEGGQRYRRTPYDAIIGAGKFNVAGIRELFVKIANREGYIPKAQRDAVVGLVMSAARTTANYFAKQSAEAKINAKATDKTAKA